MLGSCVSIKRACEFCPTSTVVTRDTVHTRDTIEVEKRVIIPADTVTLHDSIPCPDYDKTEKGKRGTVRVKIKDKKLTAECICDSIEVKYKQLTILDKLRIDTKETKVIEKSVPRKKTWWSQTLQACGYTFLSLLLLALVYGAYRLMKALRIIK
jgi:hypothetical protein